MCMKRASAPSDQKLQFIDPILSRQIATLFHWVIEILSNFLRQFLATYNIQRCLCNRIRRDCSTKWFVLVKNLYGSVWFGAESFSVENLTRWRLMILTFDCTTRHTFIRNYNVADCVTHAYPCVSFAFSCCVFVALFERVRPPLFFSIFVSSCHISIELTLENSAGKVRYRRNCV